MRDESPAFDATNWREEYDWREAFVYAGTIRTAYQCDPAPFGLDDVAEALHAVNGENDGPSWLMVGKLKDGRYFFLDAGCDYTGWDCQASGDAQVADTLENLIRYGMTTDARSRLNIAEPA